MSGINFVSTTINNHQSIINRRVAANRLVVAVNNAPVIMAPVIRAPVIRAPVIRAPIIVDLVAKAPIVQPVIVAPIIRVPIVQPVIVAPVAKDLVAKAPVIQPKVLKEIRLSSVSNRVIEHVPVNIPSNVLARAVSLTKMN